MERVKRRLNPRLELDRHPAHPLQAAARSTRRRCWRGQGEVRRQGLRLRRHGLDPICRDAAGRASRSFSTRRTRMARNAYRALRGRK